jgi:hypothetical protein
MESSDQREVCLFGIRVAGGTKELLEGRSGRRTCGPVGMPCGGLLLGRGEIPPGGVKGWRSGCLPPFRARASLVQGGALPPPTLDPTAPLFKQSCSVRPPSIRWGTNGDESMRCNFGDNARSIMCQGKAASTELSLLFFLSQLRADRREHGL